MSRIVVLGGGESGIGAAVLAEVKGHDTFLSDNSTIGEKEKETLAKYDIPYEEGNFTLIVDGFIVSDNVECVEVENIQTGFEYSDHIFKLMCRSLRERPNHMLVPLKDGKCLIIHSN